MKSIKDILKSRKILIGLFFVLILLLILSTVANIFFYVSINKISTTSISAAKNLIGIDLTAKEQKMMIPNLRRNLRSYETLRKYKLENATAPALYFNPALPGNRFEKKIFKKRKFNPSKIDGADIPKNFEDVAFLPITQLAYLIKSRKITSTQLTKLYLERLKKYGPELNCVVTITEELALKQAKRADDEISKGIYRSLLHGIPYGVKDLFATRGIKTTWGAAPYKDQIIDEDATVIKRLEQAGAVLVAKLSMGALAMGDVWFEGKTLNPWNPEQGSSGSSAGPAAATAAGLVGFSIGTETWGSIISPSTRCRVTGLRPTFGRVSRSGAMALSWSMDKIGPICRTVEDCAIVFNAIYGPDGKDLTVVDIPFNWDIKEDIRKFRVGYLKEVFKRDSINRDKNNFILNTLKSLGIDLIPVQLPSYPVYPLSFILNAEAAAAFDQLTRSNRDDLLVRQERGSWPNIFRQARFIPAVEYIQANRHRAILMQATAEKMRDVDLFVCPTFRGGTLLLTNLTGHPAVVVPTGVDKNGNSTSITFIGNLYEEEKILLIAKAFQDATDFHLKHPDLKILFKEKRGKDE